MDTQQPAKARPLALRPHASLVALVCLLLVVALGIGRVLWPAGRLASARSASSPRSVGSWPQSPWLNTRPDVKYVGDAACARCHSDIAQTFARHPMGRSLAPIASVPAAGSAQPIGRTTFVVAPSVFTIERRDGHEIHRETVFDGSQVLAQVEGEIAYTVGSGAHSIAYLVEHDGRLFQSPVTWYTQKQKWNLSPGYENGSLHFDRPIDHDCLFCHSNRFQPVEFTANRYKEPAFLGHSIGCERCHGPGELHTQRQEVSGNRDLTIVNPRHLDPALRENVCEQCHLLGDRRIYRLGRDPSDYRPGLPLREFFVDFGSTIHGERKLVGQSEQMKASQCFRASQGQLGCVSCHDPHELPEPAKKTAYYRSKCLACHADRGCSLPEPVRLGKSREDDCAGCHMPVSQATDIVHVAVSDHRIPRVPSDRPAAAKPSDTEFPLVRLDGDIDRGHSNSLGRELAIAWVAHETQTPNAQQIREFGPLAVSALDRALVDHADDFDALRMKAQALALSGRYDKALQIADSLLRSNPTHELLLADYCAYAINLGRFQSALEPAKNAVAQNPWSAANHERLAFLLMQRQDGSGAIHEAREALRLNPFLRLARMVLVQCLLHDKDRKAADDEFATLVKLHPNQREALGAWFAGQRRR